MLTILNSFVNEWGNLIILAILTVSTIIFLLDVNGLLPQCISKRLAKKKVISQKLILEEMGFNFREERHSRIRSKVIDFFSKKSIPLKDTADELVRNYTYKSEKKFQVGKREPVLLSKFVDLMSASTDPNISTKMAKILSSYIHNTPSLRYDFIITPKNGTPILGYELAKLLQVPCVFHVDSNEKFSCGREDKFYKYSKFDVSSIDILSKNNRALIVDDSTTGGRKITSLVEDLREIDCEVGDCLVIFEPTAKEVDKTLNQIGITLHSLVKVD